MVNGKKSNTKIVPTITKPNWSINKKDSPLFRPARLLMNEPIESPNKVPKEMIKARKIVLKGSWVSKLRAWIIPINVPKKTPTKSPRQVFPGPKIGLPSLHRRPPSIGGPPPKTFGVALAK